MTRFGAVYLTMAAIVITDAGCAKWLGDLRRDSNNADSNFQDGAGEDGPPWDSEDGDSNASNNSGSPNKGVGRYQSIYHADYQTNGEDDKNLVSSGTVQRMEPDKKRIYKNGSRATREDFVDESQDEGSLWASNGQTNYYFTKNKVRSPGDLVTLTIEPELYNDIGIEIKKTLSPRERVEELVALQKEIKNKFFAELEAKNKDKLATSAAAPDRAPSEVKSNPNAPSPAKGEAKGEVKGEGTAAANPAPEVSPAASMNTPPPEVTSQMTPQELEKLVPRASFSNVDILPAIQIKPNDTMMGEIIERYANGNYKIRAVKRVPYSKGPPRIVSVVGIVKAADIKEETDQVSSGKLFEHRVEVSH